MTKKQYRVEINNVTAEVLTALEPCDTDVTIISIIKDYLSEVI